MKKNHNFYFSLSKIKLKKFLCTIRDDIVQIIVAIRVKKLFYSLAPEHKMYKITVGILV